MNKTEDLEVFKEQDNNEPNLREAFFPYLRQWKWFLISVVFFLLLGYLYVELSTPVYKIESDLLIKDNKKNVGSSNDLLKDLNLFSSDKIIDNEIQILKSKTIIENVVHDLKLQTEYINTDGLKKKDEYQSLPFSVELLKPYAKAYETTLLVQYINANEVDVNGKRYKAASPIETECGIVLVKPTGLPFISKQPLEIKFHDIADRVQDYSNKLRVEPVSKLATVLIITIEDAIPQRGKDFLNKLVDEYNNAAVADKNKETAKTLDFIKDRLEVISQELNSVEKNVEQYKSNNNITDVSEESKVFLQSVGDNDNELNKIAIKLSILNNLEDYIDKNGNKPSTLPSMLGIDDPTLLGLVSQLGDVELKRLSLLQTVPEPNPMVAPYTDQVNALKEAIVESVHNLKKGLEVTQQQLKTKNSQFDAMIKQVPTTERGLLDVMRQQEIKNALFTYLLQKREETSMQLASGVADSRTIDPAISSIHPVKPVKILVYLIVFLLGVITPTAVIYILVLLNVKVNRRQDIEKLTSAPIVAEISHSNVPSNLLVSTKPRSMIAEQIRALRTNMQFIIPDEGQKVILFTSSMSGEGKSFISLNFGASLAMAGKKVVILDLDLRKPRLHTGLEMENTPGLSNFLIGKAGIDQVIRQIPLQKNYYIIDSGPIPPNPAELLANGHIQGLIAQLKQDFDYIILDAPPVGLVTDAQILSGFADATLYIVRHNYTAKGQIHALNNLYLNKKFNNLNIIVNSIDHQSGYGYGYGYGNSYGNGYGGYYEEEGDPRSSSFGYIFSKNKKK